jgi:predicted dehydrogenase
LGGFRELGGEYEVAAVCDLDTARASALAADFGVPRIVPSLDELCRMEELEIIDICTPSHMHEEHTLQALAAGKHVICEKPVAGSLAAVDRLAEAEARAGRRVMPIFNYRFGSGVQKLRQLIASGVAGQPYLATIEVAWRRRADYYSVPWRGRWETELGGTLTTHAIHFLDQLLFVQGPVRSVFARTATRVNSIETEDCASASFEMANGGLASVSVTMGSSVEISRQRYCFANLVAESNLAPYAQNTAEPWQFAGDTPDAQVRIDHVLFSYATPPQSFAGQFADFATALRSGTEPSITLADARNVIELLTALYSSARSGLPVDLPLAPDHALYGGWLPERMRA